MATNVLVFLNATAFEILFENALANLKSLQTYRFLHARVFEILFETA